MKIRHLLALPAFCVSGSAAFAGALVQIPDLYNTGVDINRVVLFDNDFDPHYTFAVVPPTGTTPIVATSVGGFPIGPWLGDDATSAWITPSIDTTGNAGNYVYRTTFTIPSGVDLSQVYVAGRFTSDNALTSVLINGAPTGITGSGNFPAYDPQFAIQKGFIIGVNTIDFVVNEASGSAGNGGFTGFRAELAGATAPVGHIAIPGLVNTGVAVAEGTPQADNENDQHFILSGTVTGSAMVATSVGGFPIGPWLGDTLASAWIAPAADTAGPEGEYFYDITFDLTGFDLSTASIYGRWSVDNVGNDILLNGVSTGNLNNNGFTAWTDFTISVDEGDIFLPGLNTLRFATFNGPGAGPTGVRIEFLSASAVPIPEPSAMLLTVAGLGVLLRSRQRK